MSKIVTDQLRKVLSRIISPNQVAFVVERWTAENTVIAQDIVHKISKHKGKERLMLPKLDMENA